MVLKDRALAFYHAAKGKVTTYVALGIAGIAQLAQHADEAYAQVPELSKYLPNSATVVTVSHYLLSALGLLVIYTRVRRLLSAAP